MYKIHLNLLALLLAFTACNQSQDSSQTSDDVTDETAIIFNDSIAMPLGYSILADTVGDLDSDSINERAIVFNTDRTGEMGIERELMIYKNDGNAWKLWHSSTGIVLPSENGGVMGDPFSMMSIDSGKLLIEHFGGSRSKWIYLHAYQYLQENWVLSNANISLGTPCEYWEVFDYDLVSGKVIYTKNEEDCDSEAEEFNSKQVDNKVTTLKVTNLPKMDDIMVGENKVTLPKINNTFYY
jgi:hypothetical protein